MRLAFRHLKLVVEPGGAVALAAALAGRLADPGRTIGVVLSRAATSTRSCSRGCWPGRASGETRNARPAAPSVGISTSPPR